MEINGVSIFTGIGGFEKGMIDAGIIFDNLYFSEVEPYAIKVYKKHFPRSIELGDITKITGEEIKHPIDIIFGGFPCQDISVAGNQEGIEGSRSGLFYEIIRLAEIVSPRIIFLENVANLLGSNKGRDMGVVLRELAAIGYDAEWDCVPAAYVGAPHRRDRFWIVAYPGNNSNRTWGRSQRKENKIQKKCGEKGFSGMSCGTSEDVANSDKAGLQEKGAEQQATGASQRSPKLADTNKPGSQRHRRLQECTGQLSTWACCRTHEEEWLARSGICRISHGVSKRVDRLKCLGNAVVPQVVEYVTKIKIMPILEGLR